MLRIDPALTTPQTGSGATVLQFTQNILHGVPLILWLQTSRPCPARKVFFRKFATFPQRLIC
jgi:hypothetical protein